MRAADPTKMVLQSTLQDMPDALPEPRPIGKYTNGSINGPPNEATSVAVEQRQWKKIAAAKQAKREQILAAHQDWRLKEVVPATVTDVSTLALTALTSREREIVKLDATDLLHSLRSGGYSAVEVAIAFCKVGFRLQTSE